MLTWLKNFFAGMNFHTLLHTISIVGICWLAYQLIYVTNESKRLQKMEQEQAKIKEDQSKLERLQHKSELHYDSLDRKNRAKIDSLNDLMSNTFNKAFSIENKLDKLNKNFQKNHVELPDPDKN
jgi:hypothetical protein